MFEDVKAALLADLASRLSYDELREELEKSTDNKEIIQEIIDERITCRACGNDKLFDKDSIPYCPICDDV